MKNGNFSPLYVAAHLEFKMDDTSFDAGDQLVNTSGSIAFPWTEFDPIVAANQEVSARFTVGAAPNQRFECRGYLFSEQTETMKLLGVLFVLDATQRELLGQIVKRSGTHAPFARKFPRIPFIRIVRVMPSRAILKIFRGEEELLFSCDVDNLSPSGIQLYSDDPRLAEFLPGRVGRVELLPRGNNGNLVQFNAVVRRVTHTFDYIAGNPAYLVGMSITSIGDESKLSFTILLREIIARLIEVGA